MENLETHQVDQHQVPEVLCHGSGTISDDNVVMTKISSGQETTEEPAQVIEKQLSFGEQLVGLTFNPSGHPKVQKAKELCAELADLVFSHHQGELIATEVSDLQKTLFTQTIGEILNAQMNVVKVLTFKH